MAVLRSGIPGAAIAAQYNVRLQRIAREVKRDVDEILLPLLKRHASEYTQDAAPDTGQSRERVITSDAWIDAVQSALAYLAGRWSSPRFQAIASEIAGNFVRASLARSERDIKRSTGIDVFSGDQAMLDYLKASTDQNVRLIKSIPEQYLDQVGTLVIANMRAGMRPSFIAQAMQEQFGVTQRRARFIARDQAAKIQGELAERQQRAAGFEYFEWIDSDDSRVRHRHRQIAEKVTPYGKGVYRWDDLPLNENGLPIKPGQDYNCRCTSRPVSARQVAQFQKRAG